jgi:hypothetical protein
VHRGVRLQVWFLVGWFGGLARPAHADFPPITSRDYAIDFYDGVAIGNTAMVGMGGAGAAHVIGTAGVLLNPSAIAVRPTTDLDEWNLDYHLDFLTGKYSSDYDNNGEVADGGASLATLGIGGRYHDWAVAATGTVQSASVTGSSPELIAEALRARITVAKWLPQLDLAVGGGVQLATFRMNTESDVPLFSISGIGIIAGATWLPSNQSFRVAAAVDGLIDGGIVEVDDCDPDDCNGYILPERVRAPWRVVAGGAYRLADSAWNQRLAGPFRDERALLIAADVVLTGATARGYGLEAFGMQGLQRSGRHLALSVRGGVEYEWLPGRLRVRAGAYWEPGRFDDVGGRRHTTFGADLRVLQFHLWGPRRGRISITSDVATRYRNVGLSIGFWR